MHNKHTAHPTFDELEACLLGKASDEDIDAIDSHLANCPSCCEALKRVKDDTFVELVQECNTVEDHTVVHSAESSTSHNEIPHQPPAVPPPLPDSQATQGLTKPPGDESATALQVGAPTAFPTEPVNIPALNDHPRYCVLERIGQGGMGEVYRAEHRMMKRSVALKIINPALVAKKSAVERFHREVEAAARLDHPNIVRAHDAGQADDLHFLVMEYVRGTDLAKVVEERGPLPVDEACEYIRQAALGLQHAHEKGMVHRDIKPQT